MTGLGWRCLRLYLEANVLLGVGAFAVLVVFLFTTRGGRRFAAGRWLAVSKVVFVASFLLPPLVACLPSSLLLSPVAELWAGRRRTSDERYMMMARATPSGIIAASAPPAPAWKVGPDGGMILLALALLGIAVAGFRLRRDWRRLRAHLDELPVWKRRGNVALLVGDEGDTPFSTRCRGRAVVVVPMEMLTHPSDLRLAVAHELQHHRQGDTAWARRFALLRLPFFWNPALLAWNRLFERLQEFACDEALLGRRGVSPQAYGGCLLRAAERAVARRRLPAGSAGIVTAGHGALLERRLTMILEKTSGAAKSWLPVTCGIGLVAFLATAAFASRSVVQEKALGLEEAQRLVDKSAVGAEIPIAMNDQVLPWVNRWVATPEGKAWFHAATTRMAQYKPMIERMIRERGLPRGLLAVPLIESGFTNNHPPGAIGVGLWGFTIGTARKYGLVVVDGGFDEGKYDERMDPEKATDAALRLLVDLNEHFQDWRLALNGYNKGERWTDEMILKLGTRDPWVIERQPETKEKYLSTFTAALLLLEHGNLL